MLVVSQEVVNGCLNIKLKGGLDEEGRMLIHADLVPIMCMFSHVIIEAEELKIIKIADFCFFANIARRVRGIGTCLIILDLKMNGSSL